MPKPARYVVMIRPTATGFSVDVPDLPGCVAAAKTVLGARRLIAEAIALHLDLMRQSGEIVPPASQAIEFEVATSTEEAFCTWVQVEPPTNTPVRSLI